MPPHKPEPDYEAIKRSTESFENIQRREQERQQEIRKLEAEKKKTASLPQPRLIGKNAAAGRDDAPVVRFDPIEKTHIVVPEEEK